MFPRFGLPTIPRLAFLVTALFSLTACRVSPSAGDTPQETASPTMTATLPSTTTPVLEQGIFGQVFVTGIGIIPTECVQNQCTLPPPKPAEGVTLEILPGSSNDPITSTVSGSTGQYRIALPVGEYRACIPLDNRQGKMCSPVLTVEAGEYVEYNPELPLP